MTVGDKLLERTKRKAKARKILMYLRNDALYQEIKIKSSFPYQSFIICYPYFVCIVKHYMCRCLNNVLLVNAKYQFLFKNIYKKRETVNTLKELIKNILKEISLC